MSATGAAESPPAAAPPAAAPRGSGRSWLYEIPLFFFFVFAIEKAFFPGSPAFYGTSPNPYWLGVLLFALRYGTEAGMAAGAAAAAVYLGGVWSGGDAYLFEDADFYLLPGLFAVAGAAIGAAADRYDERARAAERAAAGQRERAASLERELRVQEKAARAVEAQVVSQMSSLVTLYQGARELGRLERGALFDGMLGFFAEALQAEKAALHLLQDGRWVLHAERGWTKDDSYPRELERARGVIGKAGSEGKVVSLRDFFGSDAARAWEGRRRADAVMAGPLLRDDGTVIGVFSVQELPLLRFNSASVNLLSLLVDWAEASITKCFYFEELQSKLILDEVFNVYNERYFRSRSRQEFARSKTYSLPFSVLLVRVSGLDALTRDQQVNALVAVGRLLDEESREIDIVTKSSDPAVPFAMLMLTASENQALELRGKLEKGFARLGLPSLPRDGKLGLEIGIGAFDPKMKSVEEMIAVARKDLG